MSAPAGLLRLLAELRALCEGVGTFSFAVSQLGKPEAGAVAGGLEAALALHPQRCLGLAAGEEAVAPAVLLGRLAGCWPCSPSGKIPLELGAPTQPPAIPQQDPDFTYPSTAAE